jgi:hypothetical protein
MNVIRPFPLWLSRIVLSLAMLLFAVISLRFIINPTHAATGFGIATTSSLGATTLRVGFGAFPAMVGIIIARCLARGYYAAGLSIVSTLMAIVLGVRLLAGVTGDIMAEHSYIIYAEGIFLSLSLLGLFQLRKSLGT